MLEQIKLELKDEKNIITCLPIFFNFRLWILFKTLVIFPDYGTELGIIKIFTIRVVC
jgi:hypothetical protein